MQTKPITNPARSPIPGLIPEPVTLHHDPAPVQRRGTVRSTRPALRATPSGRPQPTRTLLATVLGVMRRNRRLGESPPKER
jgi:hypothetical protein